MTDTSTQGPPASSSRGFLFAIIGLIVVGLAVVALVATQTGGDDDIALAEEQTGTVTIEGAPLLGLPDGVSIGVEGNDTVVGQVAPNLVGTDFADDEVTISADGRPKAVYFLAHWCPHCQDEVPVVQQLIDDGAKPEDLDIYAVSTAGDAGQGNYPPQSWLDREGLEATIIRDDASASAFTAFGGSGFPYVIFLDGDNQVVARAAGNQGSEAISELWELTAATAG